MDHELLAPTYLFHFALPCHQVRDLLPARGEGLGQQHRLPVFSELNGEAPFAEVRAGWNEQGLAFRVEVRGKRQLPWCRATRLEESDGLDLVIDTRATHNVHRAGRFCHRFRFAPAGAGRDQTQPLVQALPIARAREPARPAPAGSLQVRSQKRIDGYVLEGCVRAEALLGFEPREQPRLGFAYVVFDRELGRQSLAIDPDLPVLEDPSLWSDLELAA